LDRIENIPKFITVSSDDEFMSMDWTNIYWDKITGEKHLLIAPNTEHFMVTGIWDIMSSMASNIRSVMMGIKKRPTFSYTYDNDTGGLTVTIPRDQEQPFEVSLRHG
jgi:PhoPQ-activated pathogenicity-related protein